MKIAFRSISRNSALAALALLSSLLTACEGSSTAPALADAATGKALAAATAGALVEPKAANAAIANPIMFVTQVPTPGDTFASRLSTFANHLPDLDSVPRGGDLMIRYPDGSLRNLTKEAGFGVDGLQGDGAIAVREPTVHWSGTKAIFSMLVGGASKQYSPPSARWQMYEVTGLAKGQQAVVSKVANQPNYNNVAPLYASDDRILFVSDRPRNGEAHLYPQLDEYESTPTTTGIFSLTPATGALNILNHAPSGAFTPFIDSFGRLIFTRWDHLQRDQQAEGTAFGAHNYTSEAASATKIAQQPETFPESRTGMTTTYGAVSGLTFNLFTPWQMNQDGTSELSLNHIGRQELSFDFIGRSFTADSSLSETSSTALMSNRKFIRIDGGLFHVREDPTSPGTYYAINAREFGSMTTNQIVRFNGAPTTNAELMAIVENTPAEVNSSMAGGRFRNPLPTTSGRLIASYTPSATVGAGTPRGQIELRLRQLDVNGANGFVVGTALTPGIVKNISWWSPDTKIEFNGALWEVEPVEVVARARPSAGTSALEAPEKSLLAEEQVDEAALRNWLRTNNLALIVTRNQTSRDRNDKQQPYNLRVPSGVQTVGNAGRIYDISHYQIFQGEQVRAYNAEPGRRVLAQPITVAANPANASGPIGSVKIAADGSTAAFVPASRALTWQVTDNAGTGIVRERVWVTMQPGEIRTCSGCHGENTKNQAGQAVPQNKPEALRQLLQYWKQNSAGSRVNGSQPLTRPGSSSAAAPATAGNQASAAGTGSATLSTVPAASVRNRRQRAPFER